MSDRSLDAVMTRSEASISQVIEQMPAWVQVCDLEGTVLSVNQAAIEISGYGRDERRREFYKRARAANPERWTGSTRNWTPVGLVSLNPQQVPIDTAARTTRQLS